MTEHPGTYIRVYDETGVVDLAAGQENSIDAAVTAYLESAGTRDSLVYLVSVSGAEYVVRASTIHGWTISTPENRARSAEVERAYRDEDTALRQTFGIWDE
jgi:hypothetical protein